MGHRGPDSLHIGTNGGNLSRKLEISSSESELTRFSLAWCVSPSASNFKVFFWWSEWTHYLLVYAAIMASKVDLRLVFWLLTLPTMLSMAANCFWYRMSKLSMRAWTVCSSGIKSNLPPWRAWWVASTARKQVSNQLLMPWWLHIPTSNEFTQTIKRIL